jgi:hypothetical protein
MQYLINILLVFLAGIIELWVAVPLGLVLKISPPITAIVSALGSICAALKVSFAGSSLRKRFLLWRYGTEERFKEGKLYKIWNNYGIIGLGLISPLLFGAPLGTALGIVLGAEKVKLLIWMTIGIIIWSIGLTTALYLGLITINPQL